ncbi:MAG: CcdB family protein [Sphingomicrobium sp.]
MPQFDVFALADGGLVVDCQADLLRQLDSRLVVPLLPAGLVDVVQRLNPAFVIDGQQFHLYPQGAATVPRSELRTLRASLGEQHYVIMNALDLLISGA